MELRFYLGNFFLFAALWRRSPMDSHWDIFEFSFGTRRWGFYNFWRMCPAGQDSAIRVCNYLIRDWKQNEE